VTLIIGALSVGVPGEVKGLYEVHKKYGTIPWKDLLQPSINLAENGFHMTLRMYEAAESMRHKLKNINISDRFLPYNDL